MIIIYSNFTNTLPYIFLYSYQFPKKIENASFIPEQLFYMAGKITLSKQESLGWYSY